MFVVNDAAIRSELERVSGCRAAGGGGCGQAGLGPVAGESGEAPHGATRLARKSSSQAAAFRLARRDCLSEALRSRFCAICLMVVKLAGAWSVRTRHSSS